MENYFTSPTPFHNGNMSGSTIDSQPDRLPQFFRQIAPALGLALLAPLVGEYLIGSTSIAALADVWFVIPIYGGAAILIREGARRTGRGWPTILLLGVAYGVIQAGLFDFSLFNPTYFGRNFGDMTNILALGLPSAKNALDFTVQHAVWSIGIPIALVETFVPERRTKPWVGEIGLLATGVLFLLFGGLLAYSLKITQGFSPSTLQLAVAIISVIVLIGIAFTVDLQPDSTTTRQAPNPWLIGVVSFIASGLWMLRPDIISFVTAGLWSARSQGWLAVAVGIVLIAVLAVVIRRWARREGWGDAHRLALTGGALLTYAWASFALIPFGDVSQTVNLIGDIVFTLSAILLLIVAGQTVRKPQETPTENNDR